MLSRDIAPPTHIFSVLKLYPRYCQKSLNWLLFNVSSSKQDGFWKDIFLSLLLLYRYYKIFQPSTRTWKKSDFGLTHNAFWLRQSHHKTKPSDWTCRCICVWNMHGWRTQSRPNMEIVSVSEDVFSVASNCGGILFWFPEYDCLLSAMLSVQQA